MVASWQVPPNIWKTQLQHTQSTPWTQPRTQSSDRPLSLKQSSDRPLSLPVTSIRHSRSDKPSIRPSQCQFGIQVTPIWTPKTYPVPPCIPMWTPLHTNWGFESSKFQHRKS
jgi:hypothetical protein